MSSTGVRVIESDVPERMDRMPWSRWHWRIVFALGITWVLDGLEVQLVGKLEDKIWHEVSGVLKDPGRLREGLERMIERERGKQDPAEDRGRLARLLDEIEGKRARFQHLYAEGVIGIDDLRARLSELDATHSQAARRMDELEAHRKRLKTLEHDKEAVLASYAALTRKRLEELSPEDRNGLYRRLNLSVRVPRGGEPKLSADINLAFSENATSC